MDGQSMTEILNTAGDFLVKSGVKTIGVIAFLIIGFKLVNILVKFIGRLNRVSALDRGVQTFLGNFIGIALKIVLLVAAAGTLGIHTTSFITIIGSAGVAIGLALQGSLSNIAGGIIILIFKPFKAGDFIETGDFSGTVEEIGLFYSKVRMLDNREVVIPNSELSGKTVKNIPSGSVRRADFVFSAGYESDIDKVKKILLDIAKNHPLVLDEPAPLARLCRHGESSLDFKFCVWCKAADYWDVFFDINEIVKKEFDKNNISIPYPQLDIHMDRQTI